MPENKTQKVAQERKRRLDRERVAAKRAAMLPSLRAEARRDADARYRAKRHTS